MISAQTSIFNFIDRGYSATLVLLPGWATDYRIFEILDLEYNYIIPSNFVPAVFKDELLTILKKHKLSKVSLLGWSMGGFAACEFIGEYSSYIEDLILAGIKQRYEQARLEQIKRYIAKNKKGYLYRFYSQCFHNQQYWDYFKKNIAPKYYEDFELNVLIQGLDYLAEVEIRTESLRALERIKIIHGEFDSIVPLEDAKKISDDLPQAEFKVVKGMGHIPFFHPDFREYIK